MRTSTTPLSCFIATNEYGSYCVPQSGSHRPAAKAILAGKVWEPETISFMRANCAGGDVVHAGMYFGDFLPGVSSALGAETLLWGFEPNPESFECATLTASINGLENVRLVHAGLGSKSGTVRIQVATPAGKHLGGKSRIIEDQMERQGTVEVPSFTIDSIVGERKVGLIQLDVEGFEQHALDGAMQTINRWRPIIVVETPPSKEWFERKLRPLDYLISDKVHANLVYQPS